MLDGTRLGNAIVDRLKAEGLLQLGKEVHHFEVFDARTGATYTITLGSAGGEWSRDIAVEASSDDPAAVAGELADAMSADNIVATYFDVVADGARVTTTAKAVASFNYEASVGITQSSGTPIEDDTFVRDLWTYVAEEVVRELQDNAEVTTSVSGTAATTGIGTDDFPTDGLADGEVMDDAAVSGAGTGTVA